MRIFFAAILLSLLACNNGLEPPPIREPGIYGVIEYDQASWPTADSLHGLWLFAANEYPLDSAGVIAGVLVDRTILIYPSLSEPLPYYVPTTEFSFALPPGTYRYVGIIQQFGTALVVSNFRVVGFLESPAGDGQPQAITIVRDERFEGLLITVDFQNPPPQPFY